MASPNLIFGCGGVGEEIKILDEIEQVLQILKQGGVQRLDTAALYPPTDIGASQRLLGQVGAARQGFTIDTKVLISMSGFQGTLTSPKIADSIVNSNNALRFGEGQRVNVLYAHVPDIATPLKEQAYGFDVQYKKGLFDKLGVCNFPAEILSEFIDVCDREGYIKPTVYQGIYNIMDRRHEGAVFDLIRKHSMQFVAHSPIAGGFLHGKLTSGNVEGTRFTIGNIMSTDARRYDTPRHHQAIRFLDETLAPSAISIPEAALRWVAFHSLLEPQDAIIFGSSKIGQVESNLSAIKKGPLPEEIVLALNGVWESLAAKASDS